MKTAFFLALKSIQKGNKVTLFLTPLIITVALVNLLFMKAMFTDIPISLDNQVKNNIYGNIFIKPEPEKSFIGNPGYLQDLIKSIPGVVGTASHFYSDGSISYDQFKDGKNIRKLSSQVVAINPDDEKKVTKINKSLVSGEYLSPLDRDKIVIGVEISGGFGAKNEKGSLGVKVGDRVVIDYPNKVSKIYTIKGLYKTGMDGVDNTIYITQRESEDIFKHSAVNSILVKIQDDSKKDIYTKKIKDLGVKEKVAPWNQYLDIGSSMKDSFSIIESILGFVSLVVVASVVFIVIFINIVTRKKHIGILKAIGVHENIIIGSYILQICFYALSGCLIGTGFMYLLIIPYFLKHPLPMGFGDVSLLLKTPDLISTVVSIFIISLIAGLIPAWQVSKEKILKAIWGI
jgi:putative ABC transport system permease protein